MTDSYGVQELLEAEKKAKKLVEDAYKERYISLYLN